MYIISFVGRTLNGCLQVSKRSIKLDVSHQKTTLFRDVYIEEIKAEAGTQAGTRIYCNLFATFPNSVSQLAGKLNVLECGW